MIIHNFYSSKNPSGENDVVRYESQLLKRLGHDVMLYEVLSDEYSSKNIFSTLRRIFHILLSPSPYNDLSRIIEEFKPDVIHCHNLFPYIGSAILKAGKRKNIRVVQTVHNYRISCIAGTHFRKDSVCNMCQINSFWGVFFKCYRNSYFQSIVMTLLKIRFKREIQFADAVICMSEFMRDWLANVGVSEAKLLVKMTSVNCISTRIYKPDGKKLLFVGRLSPEKGVETLIEAFLKSTLISKGYLLRVIGDGELSDFLRRKYDKNPEVKFLGKLPQAEVEDFISDSTVLCVPSTWFEGSPRVVSQAISLGVPVIVSKLGSLGGMPEKNWIRKVEPKIAAWTKELNCLDSWILGVDSAEIIEWARLNVSETATLDLLLRAYAKH